MSSTKSPVHLGERLVGAGEPVLVIAEAGVNHNGERDLALRLVDAAAAAGVDAVKFQTFKAERLVVDDAPKAAYQERTTGTAESQLQMLRRLELSEALHHEVLGHCRDRGIAFLSSPFDELAADLLEAIGVSAFKTPSGELTNLPLLQHIAAKGMPMLVSTGMATLGEVETAVRAIEAAGDPQVVLLHCLSNYPADPAETNLRAMATMRAAFGLEVGYSDHTSGLEVAFAAVALGAVVIEKHFTLDRSLPGPDHQASLEPAELEALIRGIRTIEHALGDGHKRPQPSELDTARVARKSLVASVAIPAGTVLSHDMVAVRRPGTGLPPAMLEQIAGRRSRVDIAAGTIISLEMLS